MARVGEYDVLKDPDTGKWRVYYMGYPMSEGYSKRKARLIARGVLPTSQHPDPSEIQNPYLRRRLCLDGCASSADTD